MARYMYSVDGENWFYDWGSFIDDASSNGHKGMLKYKRGEAKQLDHDIDFSVSQLIEDIQERFSDKYPCDDIEDAGMQYLDDFNWCLKTGQALNKDLYDGLKEVVVTYLKENCAPPPLNDVINIIDKEIDMNSNGDRCPQEPK